MIQFHENGITNRMLRSLPQATLERILPALEPLHAVQRQVLNAADRPIEHLYFINRGLVSFVKTMDDGRTIEIATAGIDGVTYPNAFLNSMDKAVAESVVRIPGTMHRISCDILRYEMTRDDALREMMQTYARFAISQLALNAACNGLHSIKERCCRWLANCHDSALHETFPLTHEVLAMMLGVQRAGISIALSSVQKAGLIQYMRGRVTIRDRPALEDAACECYRIARAEREQLSGAPERR